MGIVIDQGVRGVAIRGHDKGRPVVPVVEVLLGGHRHLFVHYGGLHSGLKSVGKGRESRL